MSGFKRCRSARVSRITREVFYVPPGLSQRDALGWIRREYRLPAFSGCTYTLRTGRLVLRGVRSLSERIR